MGKQGEAKRREKEEEAGEKQEKDANDMFTMLEWNSVSSIANWKFEDTV